MDRIAFRHWTIFLLFESGFTGLEDEQDLINNDLTASSRPVSVLGSTKQVIKAKNKKETQNVASLRSYHHLRNLQSLKAILSIN